MRDIATDMQAAIAATTGTILYFIRIDASGGPVYLATAPVDIDWDSHTWQGVGGALVFDGVGESADIAGQGVEFTLSGVDQSIVALVLTNSMRGRDMQLWLAHMDDGEIVEDPIDLGTYMQLSDYVISASRSSSGQAGTVTVSTRAQSRMSLLDSPAAVRTNATSHNDLLQRGGLATGDTFFADALSIDGKVVRWGPYKIGRDGTLRPK